MFVQQPAPNHQLLCRSSQWLIVLSRVRKRGRKD